MTTYPTAYPKVPLALKMQGNGQLNTDLLVPVYGGGILYRNAAVSFNFMYLDAKKAGHDLNNVGTYRTYERQVALWYERMTTDGPTGRVPEIRKAWRFRYWWLRARMSPVARPAESPHGWGMSIDVANASGSKLEWLRLNAARYGFGWEAQPTSAYWEPWHLTYGQGDSYTPYMASVLAGLFPNT